MDVPARSEQHHVGLPAPRVEQQRVTRARRLQRHRVRDAAQFALDRVEGREYDIGLHRRWLDPTRPLAGAVLANAQGVLVTSATGPDNPLPDAVKQNVANLGLFVFSHTLRLMADPAPELLGVLITINREIAAGLMTVPAAA